VGWIFFSSSKLWLYHFPRRLFRYGLPRLPFLKEHRKTYLQVFQRFSITPSGPLHFAIINIFLKGFVMSIVEKLKQNLAKFDCLSLEEQQFLDELQNTEGMVQFLGSDGVWRPSTGGSGCYRKFRYRLAPEVKDLY
jgi:hypothetical protein